MENNLKKEFNPRDVQRMRNIITGNTGDRTQIQTGYEKNNQVHKEGDVWEEDGKKWTIKNGIKQSVTKLDHIKSLVLMPLTCPNCGTVMKLDDYNKKMWGLHGKCFDCVIKHESELKRLGKYDEYVANIMNRNKNSELDDIETFLEEWVEEGDTFVSETGEVEKWGGGDKKSVYKRVKERIAELRELDIYKSQNL
jgi:uncharacterized Zn finger protein